MKAEDKKSLRETFSMPSLYGKLVCTVEVVISNKNVFGDDKARKLTFDVWDGFAYCYDYLGDEYHMSFPKLSLIKAAPEMAKTIRKVAEVDEDKEITVVDILQTYSQLSKL